MSSLGVQILTMDSVTSRIFADSAMCKALSGALNSIVKDVVDTEAKDQKYYYTCRYFRFDLKYIAKPILLQKIASTTTIVEDLIEALY